MPRYIMPLCIFLFTRSLLSRLLLVGELPFRVSLFHAINDCPGFFTLDDTATIGTKEGGRHG